MSGPLDQTPLERRYYPQGVVFWEEGWWVACGGSDRLVSVGGPPWAVAQRLGLGARESVWPAMMARSGEALVVTCFRSGRLGRLASAGDRPQRISR